MNKWNMCLSLGMIFKSLLLFANDRVSYYNFSVFKVFEDSVPFELRREKTGLRGFRPGPTQTGLYKLRKELEA